MFLSFVDPSLRRTYLNGHGVDSVTAVRLLEYQAIPPGHRCFLDALTPVTLPRLVASWVGSAERCHFPGFVSMGVSHSRFHVTVPHD